MIEVTYVEHDGSEHKVEAEAGQTLMQAAMDNGVPGIDADCGGSCACGTCHVIVDEAWLGKLEAADAMEDSMLGMTPEQQSGSRLSCQVSLSDELSGIRVSLPEFQM
ncbi:MAG: 2Fe-2S iron-sulfur cluster-binding protein [Candidatus Pelagadaptatus aseana]|uniref:2Fe-2S iron-sulfur cluster-binding protein n=1 Tax=Candidatus Pelagadaptatus aseana TaxID=3120508 RepID=UPI0039B1B207